MLGSDVPIQKSIKNKQKNMPFNSPLAMAEVKILVGGEEITITKPVQYRQIRNVASVLRRDICRAPAA